MKRLLLCLFLCSCTQTMDPQTQQGFMMQYQINKSVIDAHNIVEKRVTALEKTLGVFDASKEEKK